MPCLLPKEGLSQDIMVFWKRPRRRRPRRPRSVHPPWPPPPLKSLALSTLAVPLSAYLLLLPSPLHIPLAF